MPSMDILAFSLTRSSMAQESVLWQQARNHKPQVSHVTPLSSLSKVTVTLHDPLVRVLSFLALEFVVERPGFDSGA